MPDSRLPRWARALKAVILLVSGYSMAWLVGYGDITRPSIVMQDAIGDQTPTIAYVSVGLAVVGALGVLLHRWRWEWVAASVLAFALLARAVPTWASLVDHPERLSAAAGMTMAAGLMALRGIEMWWFACKTGHLARRRRALGGQQEES